MSKIELYEEILERMIKTHLYKKALQESCKSIFICPIFVRVLVENRIVDATFDICENVDFIKENYREFYNFIVNTGKSYDENYRWGKPFIRAIGNIREGLRANEKIELFKKFIGDLKNEKN